ncbi:uncharacterized protein V1516DRAFT_710588 [Lipomyces oligophaga]|uniref:uncharacterized protein n=1 Tax=Lipomyces oligophaga TaxID=45792 RepID=UPI0034CD9032
MKVFILAASDGARGRVACRFCRRQLDRSISRLRGKYSIGRIQRLRELSTLSLVEVSTGSDEVASASDTGEESKSIGEHSDRNDNILRVTVPDQRVQQSWAELKQVLMMVVSAESAHEDYKRTTLFKSWINPEIFFAPVPIRGIRPSIPRPRSAYILKTLTTDPSFPTLPKRSKCGDERDQEQDEETREIISNFRQETRNSLSSRSYLKWRPLTTRDSNSGTARRRLQASNDNKAYELECRELKSMISRSEFSETRGLYRIYSPHRSHLWKIDRVDLAYQFMSKFLQNYDPEMALTVFKDLGEKGHLENLNPVLSNMWFKAFVQSVSMGNSHGFDRTLYWVGEKEDPIAVIDRVFEQLWAESRIDETTFTILMDAYIRFGYYREARELFISAIQGKISFKTGGKITVLRPKDRMFTEYIKALLFSDLSPSAVAAEWDLITIPNWFFFSPWQTYESLVRYTMITKRFGILPELGRRINGLKISKMFLIALRVCSSLYCGNDGTWRQRLGPVDTYLRKVVRQGHLTSETGVRNGKVLAALGDLTTDMTLVKEVSKVLRSEGVLDRAVAKRIMYELTIRQGRFQPGHMLRRSYLGHGFSRAMLNRMLYYYISRNQLDEVFETYSHYVREFPDADYSEYTMGLLFYAGVRRLVWFRRPLRELCFRMMQHRISPNSGTLLDECVKYYVHRGYGVPIQFLGYLGTKGCLVTCYESWQHDLVEHHEQEKQKPTKQKQKNHRLNKN